MKKDKLNKIFQNQSEQALTTAIADVEIETVSTTTTFNKKLNQASCEVKMTLKKGTKIEQ